jgi:hypothetical protein
MPLTVAFFNPKTSVSNVPIYESTEIVAEVDSDNPESVSGSVDPTAVPTATVPVSGVGV